MAVWIEDITGRLVNSGHVSTFAIVYMGEGKNRADRYAVKARMQHPHVWSATEVESPWLSSGYLTYQEATAFMARLARLLALPHDAGMVITQDALKEGDES